jgi:hypothetical protein
MAVTPRPMAYRLAGLFMELDMRRGLNRWLGRQRRVSAHPPEARAEPADA